MSEDTLIELSKQFVIDIINACSEISDFKRGNILAGRLLRSGTSIGADIHEGNYS